MKVKLEGTEHPNAARIISDVRKWNVAFFGVADAIKDVAEFLATEDSHKGDDSYLQGIFNSIEILKSTVTLDAEQKKLCMVVEDKLEQLAGHPF